LKIKKNKTACLSCPSSIEIRRPLLANEFKPPYNNIVKEKEILTMSDY